MVVWLVTGGAGSLGRRLIEELLKPEYNATAIRVFDNNENGIAHLRTRLKDTRLRWFLGDIRDKERLARAMEHVDVCVHCAAAKHVDICEYNPFESVKTNVLGTQNCIEAALDANIDKFLTISSDKAVQACNTYGRCKALAESLTLDANNYKGDFHRSKLSVARPPNYIRSDGSVFDVWDYQKAHGLPLSVTDERMSRYFMTFDEIIMFLMKVLQMMKGGEIFIPSNCKPARIYDLAKAYAAGGPIEITGIRKGERLEEFLIDPSEKERAEVTDNMWVIHS